MNKAEGLIGRKDGQSGPRPTGSDGGVPLPLSLPPSLLLSLLSVSYPLPPPPRPPLCGLACGHWVQRGGGSRRLLSERTREGTRKEGRKGRREGGKGKREGEVSHR